MVGAGNTTSSTARRRTAPEDDNPNQIAEAVRVALEKDQFVNAGQIRIGMSNTLVRLTGVVPK
jgi:osmotically-inducible protein OsmY